MDLLRSQLFSLLLVSTNRVCTIQEGSFCIHSLTVGAQRLGLAAEEIHWQAWGVSGPTAGRLSCYKTLGTWSRPEVASQTTLPAVWFTLRRVPSGGLEGRTCLLPCSLAQEHPRPLLSMSLCSVSLSRLGCISLWASSFSLSCQLSFLKQLFRPIT